MSATLTKTYERSHIRRGRLSVDPTWWVVTPDKERWRFQRKKDARAFIDNGCVCPHHEPMLCRHCHGRKVS